MKQKNTFNVKEDSSIRSEGAELFVQSILMLEYGIISSRASRNMPAYDVIAHNLRHKKDCKISVKYRKAVNNNGFRFNSLENFDFFVGIIGNRGKLGVHNDESCLSTKMFAECNIFSYSEVKNLMEPQSKGFILKAKKEDMIKHKDKWQKILKFLKVVDK